MASGVRLPTDSTSATARRVVAAALGSVDPVGAREVEQVTTWRRDYLTHFSRLVTAGLGSPSDAVAIANAGLAELAGQLLVGDVTVAEFVAAHPVHDAWSTVEIRGSAELDAQLDDGLERGIVEPTFADAIREVRDHPEWLRLEGETVVVLGAGAEMGPYRSLLRWGADVVAIDLPRADVQKRIRDLAREG